MYAKPDSTTMKARVAKAGDAMDAALKSLSYGMSDDERRMSAVDLEGMRLGL